MNNPRESETATFDPSWEDERPVCHTCGELIAPGEATVMPAGRHVEDDNEFVGVLVHVAGCLPRSGPWAP